MILVFGNLQNDLGKVFLMSSLQGHLRRMSRKTFDKKQIHVVNTLLRVTLARLNFASWSVEKKRDTSVVSNRDV